MKTNREQVEHKAAEVDGAWKGRTFLFYFQLMERFFKILTRMVLDICVFSRFYRAVQRKEIMEVCTRNRKLC